MGLKVLKWLLPILLELVKSNGRYQGYFKRNKTITLLIIACIVSLGLGLFMTEQAVILGTNSKVNHLANMELSEKLSRCLEDKEKLSSVTCSE